MFEVVNFVNMVRFASWATCRRARWRLRAPPVLQAYKPLRTFVALVGTEIWSSGDQITVTPPAGANLDAFMKWRNDQLLKWKKHDNAHLIRWGRAEPHSDASLVLLAGRLPWRRGFATARRVNFSTAGCLCVCQQQLLHASCATRMLLRPSGGCWFIRIIYLFLQRL